MSRNLQFFMIGETNQTNLFIISRILTLTMDFLEPQICYLIARKSVKQITHINDDPFDQFMLNTFRSGATYTVYA